METKFCVPIFALNPSRLRSGLGARRDRMFLPVWRSRIFVTATWTVKMGQMSKIVVGLSCELYLYIIY